MWFLIGILGLIGIGKCCRCGRHRCCCDRRRDERFCGLDFRRDRDDCCDRRRDCDRRRECGCERGVDRCDERVPMRIWNG